MPGDVAFLKSRWQQMVANRGNWEIEGRELGRLCAPGKIGLLRGAAAGQKLTTGRFTGLGEESALLLSASLHGNLTNPSQRWQTLLMRDTGLNAAHAGQNG